MQAEVGIDEKILFRRQYPAHPASEVGGGGGAHRGGCRLPFNQRNRKAEPHCGGSRPGRVALRDAMLHRGVIKGGALRHARDKKRLAAIGRRRQQLRG